MKVEVLFFGDFWSPSIRPTFGVEMGIFVVVIIVCVYNLQGRSSDEVITPDSKKKEILCWVCWGCN
jgi:hypothetical protein